MKLVPSPGMGLAHGTVPARWLLVATILGSGMAFLDSTVVNVALPSIGTSLDADLPGLAWIVNAYRLTLAPLMLVGGCLGDRFGRRRVFLIGVLWFAFASLLCGFAPTVEVLVAARALQGMGCALLFPASLALLHAGFRPADRARAIGSWSGLTGVAGAAGPLLGGWLVQTASWRWIFLVNVPVAALIVVLTLRSVPESRAARVAGPPDVPGAVLGVVGLGALTYGLLSWQDAALASAGVLFPLLLGIAALAAFVVRELTATAPMLPLTIFESPVFSATNAVTFVVYAAVAGVSFWLVLQLQVVAGYGPLAAGFALLPTTLLLLLLSSRMGTLAQRIGPRLPMTAGPLLCALGVAGMTRIDTDASYVATVLPPLSAFGLGLAVLVAPLTATALAAAPERYAGLASGVNNAVASLGGLLAVAILPLVAGLHGTYADAALLGPAYRTAMWTCALLLAAAGLIAAVYVRSAEHEAVTVSRLPALSEDTTLVA